MIQKLIALFVLIGFSASVFSQGENLFNDNELHEIRFEVVDTSIFIQGKEYQMVNMIFDGIAVDSIGFKKKGNISASHANHKFPFKVKTNKYVGGKEYDGIKEFTLHNNYQDPSSLREKMTYDLMGDLGLNYLRTAFAKVYIDDHYWGLYTIVEGKDEMYKHVFDNRDGAVLESTDFGNMCFEGLDKEDYYYDLFDDYIYMIDNGDEDLAWEKFPIMLDKANNTSASDYMNIVPDYLNITDFIKYQAANVYLLNFDSYIGFRGNQLYYFDETTEVWEVIPWDFNASFGLWNTNNFRPFDYPIVPSNISNGCIASKINEVQELNDLYLGTLCQMVNELGDTVRWNNQINQWRAQIEDAVYEDWRKEFSNDLFDQATEYGYFSFAWEEEIPAMKTFVSDRWEYVKTQLELIDVDCSLVSSTEELIAQEVIEVAPNPTNGIINFTLSGDQGESVERVDLFNLNGQLLQTVQGQNQSFVELNMSEQQAGLYLARVYLSGSGKFVLKKIAKVQ